MKKALLATVALLLTVGALPSRAAERTLSEIVDLKKLESLLGKDWEADEGLIVDDEASIQAMPDEVKPLVTALFNQVKPLGVRAFGQLSYTKMTFPLDTLNVRVFQFGSEESARKWQSDKYEQPEAAKQYKKSERDGKIFYDSEVPGMTKRILFHKTLWVTVGHIGEGDLQNRVIEECIRLQ